MLNGNFILLEQLYELINFISWSKRVVVYTVIVEDLKTLYKALNPLETNSIGLRGHGLGPVA